MKLEMSLIQALGETLGPRGLLTDPADIEPYNEEERRLYQGTAKVVARPATIGQCSEVVRLCASAGVSVVPKAGNTGLVGGSVANADQVIISLDRMTSVRSLDPSGYRISVDAGCILADIQRVARDAGCLFPLSMASEGSARIGGALSTNAGGLNVLRYGSARGVCLGLEVVLPDGRVWDGMRSLEKDNSGYALRQLFIGAEGTLGIITGAVLKLFPLPFNRVTALCALVDVSSVVPLLARAREVTGDEVSAFELIGGFAYDLALRHSERLISPLKESYPWYVLLELATSRAFADMDQTLALFLEEAFETGLIADAAVAGSQAQRDKLWRLREGIPEAQKREGASIKHDVGVPLSKIPEFLNTAMGAVEAALPGVRPCPFGHVGDGNLHFNLTQPKGMDRNVFLSRWEEMNRIVHDIVMDMGGTFSAEHGIGRLKVGELRHYRSDVELDLMRTLKKAFDPDGIMNPGVIL